MAIVSGAHTIGKSETTNEDSYFLTERAFGVADGVSGWLDFGFSSEAFSTELMQLCKDEVGNFDQAKQQKAQDKQKSAKMRKNTSFMSFEMLEENTFEFN